MKKITEKDLFLYIWHPAKLTIGKLEYIYKNSIKFKENLKMLINTYKESKNVLDKNILIKIKNKIDSNNGITGKF